MLNVPPSLTLKIHYIISIPTQTYFHICVGVWCLKYGEDASVLWCIWAGNIEVLKAHFEGPSSFITSQFQPHLIIRNGSFVPGNAVHSN